MMKSFILILELFLIFVSINCQSQETITIDIEKELKEVKSITSSDFISKFSYIPLETAMDKMIDANPEIAVYAQLIIVKTRVNCFLYDLDSGKFIREVGRKGRGPDEFRSTKGFVNPNKRTIYFTGWKSNLLEFNYKGVFLRSIKIPGYKDDFVLPSISTNYTYLNDNIISYFTNVIGNEKKLLVIFNNDSNVLFTYFNSNIYPKSKFTLTTKESKFYHFNKFLFFKENYNDTIFRVTRNGLMPRIILFTGKYKKPYESKWWPIADVSNSEFITPFNIIETETFLFFNYFFHEKLFFGFYEKENKELKLSELGLGIDNDNDGFIPFTPLTISDKGELVGIVDSYIVQQWFINNPVKASKLPPNLQKFKNIKETDNPVVMIAKLKE